MPKYELRSDSTFKSDLAFRVDSGNSCVLLNSSVQGASEVVRTDVPQILYMHSLTVLFIDIYWIGHLMLIHLIIEVKSVHE